MHISIGIIAALIALISWGFGDFFIQRSIRNIGALGALFFIGIFGSVMLLPIVWTRLPLLFEPSTFTLLLITLIITFIGAAILFKALNVGKLSVVEPILSTELIITLIISIFLLHEEIQTLQIALVAFVFVGIVMVAANREHISWWQWWKKERIIEKGVILAIAGAFFSALINTFTALASRDTSPIETIWFVHTGLAIITIGILGYQKRIKSTLKAARKHWKPVLSQSILDNAAWIAYAKAVLTLPVGIAVAITESYIVLSTFLGISVGKEKLRPHQYIGIIIAIIAAAGLALISG